MPAVVPVGRGCLLPCVLQPDRTDPLLSGAYRPLSLVVEPHLPLSRIPSLEPCEIMVSARKIPSHQPQPHKSKASPGVHPGTRQLDLKDTLDQRHFHKRLRETRTMPKSRHWTVAFPKEKANSTLSLSRKTS